MKSLIQGLYLSVLLATTLAQAAGIEVDVFLLGGQSNARGVGVVSELPDQSIVYNERVMFYYASQFYTSSPWTSLGPYNRSHIGPEVGFGNRMAALYPDRSIAIIKHAVGGTDILSDWQPGVDANDTSHFGPQFKQFVQTVNAGINTLIARGDTPVIRAMLWQQGERDARSEAAGTIYTENLSHLIHRFREQFNAPPPFGDGIVDALDLYIAFEHFTQDPLPIDPVEAFGMEAHWTFDETEGATAHDSAGDHNGILNNNPQWQPSMGWQGGALQFDGMDDFVGVPFVVNPGPRAFSVFAWVKGAAPGQVILSQEGGMNWLLADQAIGALRTELTAPSTSGRGGIVIGPSLVGSEPITDGQWHSIGLVWDTTNRTLYVDGHEVARDMISTIESAGGDLHIGAGANLAADSFFTGLIDDVRIFKRAISTAEISSLAH
jgi:hypothetical protein